MADFGHFYTQSPGIFTDTWGTGPFVIEVGERSFTFEDSDQFGPSLLTRRGGVADRQPGERSPFWRPHWLWVRQGRQTKEDGKTCVWREPKPTIWARRGRDAVIVEQGEPDGKNLLDGKEVNFGDQP